MSTPSQPPAGSGLRIPETNTSADKNNNIGTETVDSPASPSSTNALARFEFEAGRGNEGSKILMVEWHLSAPDSADSESITEVKDGWVVSWEGKKTAFSVQDKEDEDGPTPTQRVYFLLASDVTIPPAVTISHAGTGRTLSTKCMPAIFAPGLGVDARDAGKRGVLHTIWAKKRLAQLQAEIRQELGANSESIALEMAAQERDWIIDHFGLPDPHAAERRLAAAAGNAPHQPTPTPQSPRSPIGGRLGEKLRGLKLATSSADLSSAAETTNARQQHPYQSLSPEPSSLTTGTPTPVPKPGSSAAAVASLDAVMGGSSSNAAVSAAAPVNSQTKETEDELFALPMSPRSPEMKASPFSLLK